jgi:hypothetical protein
MNTKHILILYCLAPAMAFAQQAYQTKPDSPDFHFSTDGSASYLRGSNFRTPFVTTPSQPDGADIPRNVLQFTHIDSWRYGGNFIDVSLKKSGSADPAVGGGNTGALEVYAILRTAFSLGRIGDTKVFNRGPLRDVLVDMGANLESKNSHYAPEERTIYIGPRFEFRIRRGFLNLLLHYRKEWNHQGILGRNEGYDPNFNFETVW